MTLSTLGNGPEKLWILRPLQSPVIVRHCARCGEDSSFVSTDLFRVNAQKKRLDVWLIYGCSRCQYTWNLTLFTRVRPSAIAPEILERLHNNDRELAQRFACDPAILAHANVRPEPTEAFAIEGPLPWDEPEQAFCVRIGLPFALRVRLDRVLAQKLQISRSRVRRMIEQEKTLHLTPTHTGAKPRTMLRKPAQHLQQIHIAAHALPGPDSPSETAGR